MTDEHPLDVLTDDPRELMRTLLPPARRDYTKAWELLADASAALERRRVARERAERIASDHRVIAAALRRRESSLRGDDLLNARHLASELERHAEALDRLATVSPVGLQATKDLRPEALGCGRSYRDPAKRGEDPQSRESQQRSGRRATQKPDARSKKRPFDDRGPKVARDQLGTSKHDSSLGDDLDEATRAKLEALRTQLES